MPTRKIIKSPEPIVVATEMPLRSLISLDVNVFDLEVEHRLEDVTTFADVYRQYLPSGRQDYRLQLTGPLHSMTVEGGSASVWNELMSRRIRVHFEVIE